MKVFSYIKNLARKRTTALSEDFRKLGVGLMLAGVLAMALKDLLSGGAVAVAIGIMVWLIGLFLSTGDK